MREIYFNSDITPSAVNEIKLLTLYYDKVHVVSDAVYAPDYNPQTKEMGVKTLRFIPESFENDYQLLLDEKIIEVTTRPSEDDEYENKFAEEISGIVNSNFDLIFPNHPTEKDGKIVTEEVYNVMKYMVDFDWGKPVEPNFMWWYYAFKLKWSVKVLMEGKNCLSSSNNLNQLFGQFIKLMNKSGYGVERSGLTKSLALDALKLKLPNPKELSFEDILEMKLKLKDELSLFSHTINSIEQKNKSLFDTTISEPEYQAIFFDEIQKPLRELETKMKNLKSKSFRSFVQKLQDPKSYAPLIGTVVGSVPLHYTVLVSLGLTGGMSFAEFKEEQREIRNNGLYFLLKVN